MAFLLRLGVNIHRKSKPDNNWAHFVLPSHDRASEGAFSTVFAAFTRHQPFNQNAAKADRESELTDAAVLTNERFRCDVLKMELLLIPDNKKPAEFGGVCFYLIYANTAPIAVGDIVSVDCRKESYARVLRIWITISAHTRHVPVNETESGHKHIIELDRPLGRVSTEKKIRLELIHQ